MDININGVIFYIPKVIKNTAGLSRPQPVELKVYNKDELTCPVCTVDEYTKGTEKIRNY